MDKRTWLSQFRHEVKKGSVETLRNILDKKPYGISVDEKLNLHIQKMSALEYFIRYRRRRIGVSKKNIESIKLLLKKGADILQIIGNGERPALHRLFFKYDEEVLMEFLPYLDDEDIDTPLDDDATLLHLSILNSKKSILEYVIQRGADVNIPYGESKDKPLHMAIMLRHSTRKFRLAILKTLIKNGADINCVDLYGNTPLHAALSKDPHDEIIDVLLAAKPNMNVANINHMTPLNHLLIGNVRRLSVLEKVLKSGCDPNNCPGNNEGNSLHHLANSPTGYKISEASEILIKYGADVNFKDAHGNIPLHYAVENGYTSLVVSLIRNGTDVTIQNDDDLFPMNYIILPSLASAKIAALLVSHILLKVHTQKLEMTDELRSSLESFGMLMKLKRRCEMEIKIMKNKKIGSTNITFYEILTSSTKKVAKYMKHRQVASILRRFTAKKKSKKYCLVYGEKLEEIINAGWRRRCLEEDAMSLLRILSNGTLAELIIKCTVKYFPPETLLSFSKHLKDLQANRASMNN